MSRHRFYAPKATGCNLSITLPHVEANQLARVLRLKRGRTVNVFDGQGREFVAEIEKIEKNIVTLRTLKAFDAIPEPKVHITLALSLLKGRLADNVVRDATMVGATIIQPLLTTRSQNTYTTSQLNKSIKRWESIAISSSKQCGRAVVPSINQVRSLKDFLKLEEPALRIILVEPTTKKKAAGLDILQKSKIPSQATILVGPEGGWTPRELEEATKQGFHPVTFGSRTLRADATPIVSISLFQYLWSDL